MDVVIADRRIDRRMIVADPVERMGAGNAEADYILGGGFPVNSINIVMGHPGSGKTIFAEQLIFHNAGDDRPITYKEFMVGYQRANFDHARQEAEKGVELQGA